MTKGDLDADKKEQLSNHQVLYEKLLANTEILADLLSEEMPNLTFRCESETKTDDEEGSDGGDGGDPTEITGDGIQGQWEDEDTKSFYRNLIDIKEIIPGILLEAVKSAEAEQKALEAEKKAASDKLGHTKSVEEELDDIMDLETLDGTAGEDALEQADFGGPDQDLADDDLDGDDTEETAGSSQNTSKKMLFDAFLANLPTCVNRDMIDNAAADFCMTFNTKGIVSDNYVFTAVELQVTSYLCP